jgi:hypothetical protein
VPHLAVPFPAVVVVVVVVVAAMHGGFYLHLLLWVSHEAAAFTGSFREVSSMTIAFGPPQFLMFSNGHYKGSIVSIHIFFCEESCRDLESTKLVIAPS